MTDEHAQRAYKRLYSGEPISNNRVLDNVLEARSNGHYLACTGCGVGMTDADFETPEEHEENCPNRGRDRLGEMIDMLADRTGRTPEELLDAATTTEEEESS